MSSVKVNMKMLNSSTNSNVFIVLPLSYKDLLIVLSVRLYCS